MSSTRVLTPSEDLNERNSQQRTLPWDRCKGNDYSGGMTNCGPWGIYLVSENTMNVDDLTHFTLKEWTRMSISPTIAEVERAKSEKIELTIECGPS
ncbi:hypothetical protein I352_05344 [Cryptococcus deuterogattii MMRL2647]|nr:hypothetical protein I352_05344 [Cryptococcus deuterogattii MMRL2647]